MNDVITHCIGASLCAAVISFLILFHGRRYFIDKGWNEGREWSRLQQLNQRPRCEKSGRFVRRKV